MTVPEFLDQLPPARRREIDLVRALIRRHLPGGYEEVASMPLDRWVAVAKAARRGQ